MSFKIGLYKFDIDVSLIHDKEYLIGKASILRTIEDKWTFYEKVYSL